MPKNNDENIQRDVFTIAEFCLRNRIAQSTYFAMARKGIGPRVMKIMNSVRITAKAEEDWRHDRENASNNMKTAS